MPQDVRNWRLDQLTSRLVELLKEEPRPRETMQALSRRLIEENLSLHSPGPKESPEQFAQTVIRDNPQMWDLVSDQTLPNLEAIETADELVTRLIPSRYDHG